MTRSMQAAQVLGLVWQRIAAALLLSCLWGTALAGELITYYHNDVAGSPIAATDEKGYYIWRTSYEPYGQRIQNDAEYAASIDNNRWFTGHVEDVETGTLYMQARHYDPTIGRFMSVDPIRFVESEPHTFTRYAYAANNPYRYTDPDGEFINFIIGGVKAAVENIAIQHIEMAMGTRDTFSWGELAFDTTLGAATSGLSTIKNAARVANMASDVAKMEHAGDATGALKMANQASDAAKGANAPNKQPKAFSSEKQALVDMAKSDKRKGITSEDMQAYKDLNKDLPDPFPVDKVRGPEAHATGAPSSQALHGHVGPVDHIPIVDVPPP